MGSMMDLAQARIAQGAILSEPGFAWENEEGEPAVRLDEEKVLSLKFQYPKSVRRYLLDYCAVWLGSRQSSEKC